MRVGIYMPVAEKGHAGPPLYYDGVEKEYFRRAFSAVLGRSTYSDVELFWFDEGDNPSPCESIRTVSINEQRSSLSFFRSADSRLEQSVKEQALDVLLTRIDVPSMRLPIPRVLFAADMLFHGESPPGSKTPPPPLNKRIKQSCTQARGILCPSTYVHRSCASRLEMGLEKAIVARAGVDETFSKEQDPIIEEPYALFILNRYTYPAVPMFLEAVKQNASLFPENLVVLGPIHPQEPESWELPVVRIEDCPDSMAAALMQHAEVCFYPAHGDGSGMPVLQALNAGAILITTKSGALFEIAGAAPFYCEVGNHISLLQSLRRAQNEKNNERRKRKQSARSLVLDCTWERCGTKILSTLKRSLLTQP